MRILRKWFLVVIFVFSLLVPAEVHAQGEDESIVLQVVKVFGFRVGNKLQGRIGLRIEGPSDLTRVDFYLDDTVINEDDHAPFRYDFSTGEITPGEHTLSAIGFTQDGRVLPSNVGTYTILSADEAVAGIQKYMIPLLLGVVVFLVMAGALSAAITKRTGPKYKIGDYGPAGGAVCSRCGMPFSRHVLSPNLVVGKLERCPNCGAVGVVRRGSPMEMKVAEERLLADMQKRRETPEDDENERLRRMLEETRYDL
jgi:hypothetical protein